MASGGSGPRWPDLLAHGIAALAPSDETVVATEGISPRLLVDGYRAGAFPMPHARGIYIWLSPAERAVLRPGRARITRSLARSMRRYAVTVDNAFAAVLDGCAHGRPLGWIDATYEDAYRELFAAGYAHSVEVWQVPVESTGTPAGGWQDAPPPGAVLAGGLLGVGIGMLVAGESMFHRRRDASKVAVMRTLEVLEFAERAVPGTAGLLDAQWMTSHLASLGFAAVPRADYVALAHAASAGPDAFDLWKASRAGG